MNKTLITFFTILFCLTSSISWSETIDDLVKRDGLFYKKFTQVPFTGKITGKKTGSFKNGKKDDSWIAYYDNGQLNYKGDFKNGKREGSWISYWDNGHLGYKGDFKNGNEEGFWINHYDNGQLWMKGNYKNGKREGSWVWYHKGGTIWKLVTGTYKDGKKISD